MDPSVLDDIIRRLLDVRNRPGKQVQLTELEVRQLCTVSRDIFIQQPCLLELEAPIKIVGDIHGHYSDLLRLFEYGGFPPEFNYLFLGNYVDYGKQSLETMWLLLAYKIKYPENFFLLRGNHECASITRIYGFYDECKRRFNVRLWKVFVDCFSYLPVAALIDDKIFCVHGGLSPDLNNLDQIRNIQRPTDVPDSGLLCDLLWSDPSMDVQGWGMNDREVSYTFGADKVMEFLDKHDLDLVCRSHQIVEDGYEFFANRQLVTLFSAPNYRGEYDNAAAIMSIDDTLMCTFQILKPAERRLVFSFGSLGSTTQPGSSSGANLFSNTTSKFEDEVVPVNKPAERMKNSYFKSRPSANKSESTSAGVKPSGSTVSANFRSNSPGFKLPESTNKPDSGSDNATTSAENPPGINLVKFNFDPNSLYRSKSPGVKRFLGARV